MTTTIFENSQNIYLIKNYEFYHSELVSESESVNVNYQIDAEINSA